MDNDEQFSAVPPGQENAMLMMSVGFLVILFTAIGAFVAKLWYDERQAGRTHASTVLVDEILGAAAPPQEERRRNRRAQQEEAAADEGAADAGNFQPGRRADIGSDEEEGSGTEEGRDAFGRKYGKKKLAKLQAKADARADREAMLAQRDEKKKRVEKEREEREAQDKAEADLVRQEAEEEKKRREEQAAKEHEEYLKLKAAFSVEEEGYDQKDENTAGNIMAEFISYVKTNKAVNIDELAAIFKLKVDECMERLQHFISTGQLSGVIDDRGKFIFITQEELNNVSKYVTQRGRVSLSDLAEYSNRFISLEAATQPA